MHARGVGLQLLLLLAAVAESQDAVSLYKKVKSAVVVVETNSGNGTGFFVDDGRFLVTAAHVLKDVTSIRLQGASVTIKGIVHYDEDLDIALLALDKRSKSSLKLQSRLPDPGTKVYVIGTPLGVLDRSISDGIVSAVRPLASKSLIQFTAAVSPGSSGSPLVDTNGRVMGLVLLRLREGQALNFAVSAKDLSRAINAARVTAKALSQRPESRDSGKVIGKLGQVIAEAPIRELPSSESRVYYTARKFQYLVLNPSPSPDWFAVLLQNGAQGYVESARVVRLPYDVRVSAKPDPDAPTVEPAPSVSDIGLKIAETAAQTLDWPYKSGGTDLGDGCDEKSFTWLVLARVGVVIPRALDKQSNSGVAVERIEHLRPGDLLFFWGAKEKAITEAGIFLGFRGDAAYFIHADKPSGKITTADLATSKWRARLVGARRIYGN